MINFTEINPIKGFKSIILKNQKTDFMNQHDTRQQIIFNRLTLQKESQNLLHVYFIKSLPNMLQYLVPVLKLTSKQINLDNFYQSINIITNTRQIYQNLQMRQPDLQKIPEQYRQLFNKYAMQQQSAPRNPEIENAVYTQMQMQMRTTSQVAQKEVRQVRQVNQQPRALPIVYDSPNTSSAKKNSRVVYMSREENNQARNMMPPQRLEAIQNTHSHKQLPNFAKNNQHSQPNFQYQVPQFGGKSSLSNSAVDRTIISGLSENIDASQFKPPKAVVERVEPRFNMQAKSNSRLIIQKGISQQALQGAQIQMSNPQLVMAQGVPGGPIPGQPYNSNQAQNINAYNARNRTPQKAQGARNGLPNQQQKLMVSGVQQGMQHVMHQNMHLQMQHAIQHGMQPGMQPVVHPGYPPQMQLGHPSVIPHESVYGMVPGMVPGMIPGMIPGMVHPQLTQQLMQGRPGVIPPGMHHQMPQALPPGLPPGAIPVPPNLAAQIGMKPEMNDGSTGTYILSQTLFDPVDSPQKGKTDLSNPKNIPIHLQFLPNAQGKTNAMIMVGQSQTPQKRIPQQKVPRQQMNPNKFSSTNSRVIVQNQNQYVVEHKNIDPRLFMEQKAGKSSESSISTAPRPIPPGMSAFSSGQTVPKAKFDRCVTQCKNWQVRYNQLYQKYLSLMQSSSQIQSIKSQNKKLKNSLKQQQQKNTHLVPMLQAKFSQIVSSQRQATIKQCMLLIQRFKLQSKTTRI